MLRFILILVAIFAFLTPAYAVTVGNFQDSNESQTTDNTYQSPADTTCSTPDSTTANDCPPTEETSTGTPRLDCKPFYASISSTYKKAFIFGEYVKDKETLYDEAYLAQEAVSDPLNGNLGNLGALTWDEQASWVHNCKIAYSKNRCYDPTKVPVDGAVAPKFIIDIYKLRISSANNSDNYGAFVSEITDGCVDVNTDHYDEQTIVEYWAYVRDAKTHKKLCNAQKQDLKFYGKSIAVNEDTSISIYGYTIGLSGDRSREKDSNLDVAHQTAGAALAKNICETLKCYPL